MSHGDYVLEPPPGFVATAKTISCPIASMANIEKKLFGVQFHPEVVHTPWGIEVIRNFLYKFCECRGEWTMENFVETEVARIREQVGDDRVLCALSGGVDSAVAAVLIHKAVGDKLTCLFVNHGFLRKNEAEQVRETFAHGYAGMNFEYVDASREFLELLKGRDQPGRKAQENRQRVRGDFRPRDQALGQDEVTWLRALCIPM